MTNCPHCQATTDDLGALLCPTCRRPLASQPASTSAPAPVHLPDPPTNPPNAGGRADPTLVPPSVDPPSSPPRHLAPTANAWAFHVVSNNGVTVAEGAWVIPLPRGKLLNGEPAKIGRRRNGPVDVMPDVNLAPLDADRTEPPFRVSRELGLLHYRSGTLWLTRHGTSKVWYAGATWPADQPAEPVPVSGHGNSNPIELHNGDELTFGASETDFFTLKLVLS